MRDFLFLVLFLIFSFPCLGQEGQKINVSLDLSSAFHYSKGEVNNPYVVTGSVGYEYDFFEFFGVEAGFKGGVFYQKVGYELDRSVTDVYKGSVLAPFVAPRLYIPISTKDERESYLFLVNKFTYNTLTLDLDKITRRSGSKVKGHFQYEIKLGYQYPVNNQWAINCWLGYDTFDFSVIDPSIFRFKSSTPIQIGIGFNYIIKSKMIFWNN